MAADHPETDTTATDRTATDSTAPGTTSGGGEGRVAVISGATGLMGTAVAQRLLADGWEVRRLVRAPRTPGPNEIGWNIEAGTIDSDALEAADAVIHLAGAGIGDRRWNDAYKQVLVDSRVRSTKLLASAVAGLSSPPSAFIVGSAMGYYGDRGDEILTEESPRGDGFLPDLCHQWETAAQSAVDTGIRTAFLRTSLVLSTDGGVLPRLLIPFRLGLGGKLGDGGQWVSWISLQDTVEAILHLVEHPVSGPVNLATPEPVTNAEQTEILGRVLNRPTLLTVPACIPRLVLGEEMANALLFDSTRLAPAVLEATGFEFAHPTLESALTDLLER